MNIDIEIAIMIFAGVVAVWALLITREVLELKAKLRGHCMTPHYMLIPGDGKVTTDEH